MSTSVMKMIWLPVCSLIGSLLLLPVMTGAAKSEGVKMPDTIVINKIQNKYSPVSFNHAMHVNFAGSCGECHHVHNENNNSTCTQCHSIDSDTFRASVKNSFPPCSGCHMEYSPEMPELPGLKVALHKKCFKCHIGIGELGASPKGCVKTCHIK